MNLAEDNPEAQARNAALMQELQRSSDVGIDARQAASNTENE